MKLIIPLFLIAFVCANLLVKHFGAYGLWISSALLIPFDFICRCIIHEKLKGSRLLGTLFLLTIAAAGITIAINHNAVQIALASIAGFTFAQIAAGIMYQVGLAYKRSYFIKVNASDLIAVIFDSLVFQIIAFSEFNPAVTIGQICIKFTGGLIWYWIIFKVFKYNPRPFSLPSFSKKEMEVIEKESEKELDKIYPQCTKDPNTCQVAFCDWSKCLNSKP